MVVLMAQQICVAFGRRPVFIGLYNGELFPWKLNSLTAETAHSSFILSMLMLLYSLMQRRLYASRTLWDELKEYPSLWICYAWVLFSPINATAYIWGWLALVPYLAAIKKRTLLIFASAGSALITIIVVLLGSAGPMKQFQRIGRTAEAIVTLDEEKIVDADMSAACRILPIINGAKAVGDLSIETLIGHGVDAMQRDLPVPPNWRYDEKGSAGIFNMWYNYGLVCTLLLWGFAIRVIFMKREPVTWLWVIIAIGLSGEYNFQHFWLIVAIGMIYKYCVVGNREILEK